MDIQTNPQIESSASKTPAKPSKIKLFWQNHKPWIIVSGALLLLSLAIYLNSNWAIAEVKKEAATQKAQLEEEVSQFLTASTEELLRFSSKGLNWAVRGELLRGNKEQVQQYITQLVKEERIEQVEFVDPSGMIEMSSDKNREGGSFNSSAYTENPLQVEAPQFQHTGDGKIEFFAPVMGLEKRLGTLRIVYMPKDFAFSAATDTTLHN